MKLLVLEPRVGKKLTKSDGDLSTEINDETAFDADDCAFTKSQKLLMRIVQLTRLRANNTKVEPVILKATMKNALP